MPAKSKSQQRFMGMVHALQKGELSPSDVSDEVKDAADQMDDSDAEDYASTKHSGKPEHVPKEVVGVARKLREMIRQIIKENPSLNEKIKLKKEVAKRDYKAEYKKFQSSDKAKKYRAELNQYNRKKGTYGNGDGKDASHKGGKIVGFEKESTNRGRAEKSRLKKEVLGKRCTVTEISKWLKTLEEFRYRKVRGVDARRVASFVNSGMNEEELPLSLQKKWEYKQYGREKHLANKYVETVLNVTLKESVNEVDRRAKSQIFREWNKFEKEYGNFFKAVVKLGKVNTKVTGDKTDEKIFLTDFTRNVGKFYSLMQSWVRGQNESVNEYDLGLTYKKGKTVKVTHKKSGKELVIVDKPNVKREYEKIGYFAEGKKTAKTYNEMNKSLITAIKSVKNLRKLIDDAPYNPKLGTISANLYKFEIDLEKKLRTFIPQIRVIANSKMMESVNEKTVQTLGKVRLSSIQKKAILIAMQMFGNMTGAVKKIEKLKTGLSKDKAVAAALRFANESINEARTINVEPNWEGVWRYFKYMAQTNPAVWKRMQRNLGSEWGKLEKMAQQKRWQSESVNEEIAKGKGVQKIFDIQKNGYGKLGGRMVDQLSAGLFTQLYDKAPDNIKEKMNKMNEKRLYIVIGKMWDKFGKSVTLR